MAKRKSSAIQPCEIEWNRRPDKIEMLIKHPPVPAARPRITRWSRYYPKTYQDWMDTVRAGFEQAEVAAPELCNRIVFASVHSVRSRPQRMSVPLPAGDVDNLGKAVWDMITETEAFWIDDKQIMAGLLSKRYCLADEKPHSYVRIATQRHIDWVLCKGPIFETHDLDGPGFPVDLPTLTY